MGTGVATHKSLHSWNHDDVEIFRREVFDALGDLSEIFVAGHQVIVADYVRPAITKSGLWTPGSAQAEDVYQGTVAMVVKLGHLAFKSEESEREWDGHPPKVGDHVYFRPQDTVMCSIRCDGWKMMKDGAGKNLREWEGWMCRLVYARDIYMRVARPHIIL